MRRILFIYLLVAPLPIFADTLELADGTTVRDCYVRDEGVRLLVWSRLADVGSANFVVYPRSKIKSYKVERGDDWDAHPALPDLSVTYIEITPKLAGLHGVVDYDSLGRPSVRGGETTLKKLKLAYSPGEKLALTAHVKNLGFATAAPFDLVWLIDGREVKKETCRERLAEMRETSFRLPYEWREGQHTVTVRIVTDQAEIAKINNEATDPLWGWGYFYIVHKGRVAAWHEKRTAYGTFSFEDFYRWHLDIMNLLFAASIYPSAPQGITARVRLDRIVYAEDVEKAVAARVGADGIAYDQGGWIWQDDEDKNKAWKPATKEWRNATEWSLPHELGHQLGLVDYYNLDYDGSDDHKMADNGEKVTHFQNHPVAMMHWHGPQPFNETDAGYLNMTFEKPRGHFGDYYFAIPAENYLRVVDVNGQPVAGASVEVFQRGVVVDPKGASGDDHGVKYFPAVEDGNFDHKMSKDPVMIGATDGEGLFWLANRPVAEVSTFNGFRRGPNPFGNINVVGNRGLMYARVTKSGRACYYSLEATEFNTAWFRGQRDRYTLLIKTPFGSTDSPNPPAAVAATGVDAQRARVSWSEPPAREQHYLERPIGYRVYRRVSSDCLNDRPWVPVATLGPEAREFVVDLGQYPNELHWFSKTNRFAVSTIGERGTESALAEALMVAKP